MLSGTEDHQPFVLESIPGSDAKPDIINIEVATDPTTGEKFIFWEDIETFFPGMQHVHRDNIMVAYMRDMNGHRYRPRRIKHYPGAILQVSLTTRAVSAPPPAIVENHDLDALPPEYSASSTPNAAAGTVAVPVAVPVDEKRVWIPPAPVVPVVPVEEERVGITPQPVVPGAVKLQLSCPRLFLVLPMDGHPLDPLAPDQNKFTVHFLCYGGDSVKIRIPGQNDLQKIPGHVHVCEYRGFEVERPVEFFDQYGHYILNMLQMLQHGFPVQGKACLPLKELEYDRIFDQNRGGTSYFPKVRLDLEQSILQMISYLQTTLKGQPLPFEEHAREDMLDALGGETTDLSAIRSYFKDLHASFMNDDEILGDLVRGNMEGSHQEVWLCHSHYNAIFDTKAAKALHVAVSWDKGFYEYKDRKLKLILKMNNKTTAFQQYSYLIGGAKNARELDLTIDCDPSMAHLEHLGNIIALNSLRKITLNLKNYSRPSSGMFRRGKSTDPWVHILFASPALEKVDFQEMEGFFSKSSSFSESRQTRLQEIHIDSLFDPRAHAEKLAVLFRQCPRLQTLSLACPKGDRFNETIELVKEHLIDHKYFRYLNVTCPAFKAVFDRAEPGSTLLDPVLPLVPGARAGVTTLQRYWRDLETIISDVDFCDAEIDALAELLSTKWTRLQQFHMVYQYEFMKVDLTTDAGRSKLLKAVEWLSHYPRGLVEGPPASSPSSLSPGVDEPPEKLNDRKVAISPVRSPVRSRASSSPRVPPSSIKPPLLFEASMRVKYPPDRHRRLAIDMFPYVVRFEMEIPNMNDVIPRFYNNVNPKRPSLIRYFHYSAASISIKEPTLECLIQILKLCPGLEILRLTRLNFKTGQWRRVLGCLDYSRLQKLECPRSLISTEARKFPAKVLPTDAILQELNLYKSYLSEPLQSELISTMAERLPDCKVIFRKVRPQSKSLLHIP